jgi:hypothetical protein
MNAPRRQRGAALFTALIFLIIITLLSLQAMRSSTLELRMASNEEAKITAFQRVQAIIDATVIEPGNTQVFGEVGRRVCSGADADDTPDGIDCDAYDVLLADDLYADDVADGRVRIAVTRLAPLERPAPRALGTSAAVFAVAAFQVDAEFDGTDIGTGGGRIVEGVMVLIPKS